MVPPFNGVLKSVEGGQQWATTGLIWKTGQRHYGHRIAIHARTPAILLVASTTGLPEYSSGLQSMERHHVLHHREGRREHRHHHAQ